MSEDCPADENPAIHELRLPAVVTSDVLEVTDVMARDEESPQSGMDETF